MGDEEMSRKSQKGRIGAWRKEEGKGGRWGNGVGEEECQQSPYQLSLHSTHASALASQWLLIHPATSPMCAHEQPEFLQK